MSEEQSSLCGTGRLAPHADFVDALLCGAIPIGVERNGAGDSLIASGGPNRRHERGPSARDARAIRDRRGDECLGEDAGRPLPTELPTEWPFTIGRVTVLC